jgi:hypothetical protein
MQIVNGAEELLEIIARELFVKTASSILNFDVRKEITLLYKFQHDEIDLNSLPRILHNQLAITVVLDQLDDVWVVHFAKEGDFVH